MNLDIFNSPNFDLDDPNLEKMLTEGQKSEQEKIERKSNRMSYLAWSIFTQHPEGKELWAEIRKQLNVSIKPGPYLQLLTGMQNYVRWLQDLINFHKPQE